MMNARGNKAPANRSETTAAHPNIGFVASTGRTATMFMAATLDSLPGVTALHEGHEIGESATPRLPLINVQNRLAWSDPVVARRTVSERRNLDTLRHAAGDAGLVVDAAFYNAPLLQALVDEHPSAYVVVVFRRCESFVRSATMLSGEDAQPAGWPDPAKTLTDRERFIELGRLRPQPDSDAGEAWPNWSGVQRNIWLWHAVNSRLVAILAELRDATALFFEDLVSDPRRFWSHCLAGLGLDRPGDLDRCVERSGRRINPRPEYHVGPVTSWTEPERRLYERLGVPLEYRIYERR